jgi:ATPase subunit of ABC transporter with duplicated ATPase domains
MPDIVAALKTLGVPVALLQRRWESLSGGWRMRIVLAKALLYRPQLLLLDEPTNHLDIGGINHLATMLTGPAFRDTTMVFVSHDLYFVNAVAEWVIQLQVHIEPHVASC